MPRCGPPRPHARSRQTQSLTHGGSLGRNGGRGRGEEKEKDNRTPGPRLKPRRWQRSSTLCSVPAVGSEREMLPPYYRYHEAALRQTVMLQIVETWAPCDNLGKHTGRYLVGLRMYLRCFNAHWPVLSCRTVSAPCQRRPFSSSCTLILYGSQPHPIDRPQSGRIGAMLAWLLSIGPITPQPALITYLSSPPLQPVHDHRILLAACLYRA